MKIQLPDDLRIFLACGQTDMRKSIDGLTAMISLTYKLDPFQHALFLFCGRRKDRMKAILWEGDGFLLLYRGSKTEVFSGLEQWMKLAKSHLNNIGGSLKVFPSIKRK